MSAADVMSEASSASESVSIASGASGPVLSSGLVAVLNHCALPRSHPTFRQRGLGQLLDRRPFLHPLDVIFDDCRHARLLQHDLRNQHGVTSVFLVCIVR